MYQLVIRVVWSVDEWEKNERANEKWQRNTNCHLFTYIYIALSKQANAGTMLGQRQSQWSNIVTTLVERLVFAGILVFDKMALGL